MDALIFASLLLCSYFVMLSLLLFVYFVEYVLGYNVKKEEFLPKAIMVGYHGNKDGSSNDGWDDAANGDASIAAAASLPPLPLEDIVWLWNDHQWH